MTSPQTTAIVAPTKTFTGRREDVLRELDQWRFGPHDEKFAVYAIEDAYAMVASFSSEHVVELIFTGTDHLVPDGGMFTIRFGYGKLPDIS